MRMNAANILTLSRLAIVPLFVAAFILELKIWAIVLFCVAGLTDVIDGVVARYLGQVSRLGGLLDPIADKLLVESCFLTLALVGVLPWWFFVLAFLRDAMIMSGIFYLEWVKASFVYRPLWISKFATVFQLVVGALGIVRWWNPEGSDMATRFLGPIVVVTAVLIVISGVQYVRVGLSIIRQHSRAQIGK